MSNSRRDFLKKSIGLVSLSVAAPHLWVRPANAKPYDSDTDRILVVLQLDGGNDGLNTVIPFTDSAYRSARPALAIPEANVLKLTSTIGLHPSMAAFMPLYQANKLAIVQGAGYPSPNRSHFRSREIWQTSDPVTVNSTGWLGRYADRHLTTAGDLAAVTIGGSANKSMAADEFVAPAIPSLTTYTFSTDEKYPGDRTNQVNALLATNNRPGTKGDTSEVAKTSTSAYEGSTELQTAATSYSPKATYPSTEFARQMQFVAQIIVSNVGTRVIQLTYGGFDTHSGQPTQHANLWTTVSEALAAFQADIEAQGLGDRVALLAFSEFGRRVEENGSQGTDHGTAGPMLVLGSKVKGGLHGEYPSLTSLDSNKDLIFKVDFRQVYADMVETWLQADSKDVLLGTYSPLGLFNV